MARNICAVITVVFWLTVPLAAEDPPDFQRLKIGDAAPDFKLPGIDDRDWVLADFKDAKVLMVYFTSNHCPVCHAHDPRLITLLKELEGQSIAVVAINPNSGDGLRIDELGYSPYDDSFEDMKPYAKDEGFTFPYLYDGETQATAKKYGCLATPHVFLFDQNRKLRYQGRFDDSRYPDPATVKNELQSTDEITNRIHCGNLLTCRVSCNAKQTSALTYPRSSFSASHSSTVYITSRAFAPLCSPTMPSSAIQSIIRDARP